MARLSKDEWCMAALTSISDSGIPGLSVERLAKQLGVTKGSFYWHFKNRGALISAMLELWRVQGTEEVIQDLEQRSDPRTKLHGLFEASLSDLELLKVEAVLGAAASNGHPIVAPVFEAVSHQRLSYLEQVYQEIGVEAPQIWARGAYAAYLGSVQLSAMRGSPITASHAPALVDLLAARWVP